MVSEIIEGFCPKLKKNCVVVAQYKKILMAGDPIGHYKFMNSRNIETGISCYRDREGTTFYNCELFKECDIDIQARSKQR